MICTLRRVEARLASIRLRMSISSRAAWDSAVSTSRRPGPRSRALRISAARIRSAPGSSRSSPNFSSASGSGSRVCSRSMSRRQRRLEDRRGARCTTPGSPAPARPRRRSCPAATRSRTRAPPAAAPRPAPCAAPPNSLRRRRTRAARRRPRRPASRWRAARPAPARRRAAAGGRGRPGASRSVSVGPAVSRGAQPISERDQQQHAAAGERAAEQREQQVGGDHPDHRP